MTSFYINVLLVSNILSLNEKNVRRRYLVFGVLKTPKAVSIFERERKPSGFA